MKTVMLIDGANIHAASKQLNYDVDYARLKAAFNREEGCTLLRAIYYTATIVKDDGTNPLRKLLDYLEYNGYTVVTKESKQFEDVAGVIKIKGNMDVEIAVDCMLLSDHVEHIILFSGDGDFTCLVKAAQAKGCRVTVVSTMCMIADELRRQCDDFIDMALPSVRLTIRKDHKIGQRNATS